MSAPAGAPVFDPYDYAFQDDPYPTYRWLREEDPVHHAVADDIWVMERVAHTLGTCRMGHDGETAVVDPFGRSFEIDNLWISDGSTFPSSLAANPALTIMALALRSAEQFLAVGGR